MRIQHSWVALVALGLIVGACTESAGGLNAPPVADAGEDRTVLPGTGVVLSGANSRDPDGEIVSFAWIQSRGPNVATEAIGAEGLEFDAPDSQTDLEFTLVVTDDQGATATDEVRIEVSGNEPPVADAGPDRIAASVVDVTLDGTGSRDEDGEITTYSWTQTEGIRVVFDDAASATPSFVTPPRASKLRFELEVTDDGGATAVDFVRVEVLDNLPPVADAGPDVIGVVGERVVFDGSQSVDPDGDALRFAWRVIEGPALTLDELETDRPEAIVPDTPAVWQIELAVTDAKGATSTDTVALIPAGVDPDLEVTFPTEGGDVEGRTNRLIVAGRASDPNGTEIVEVTVNGQPATFADDDEPDYWTVEARIDSDEPEQDLLVVAVDQAGERSETTRSIRNQVSFFEASFWAWDGDANRAVVIDARRGLMTVDAATGRRRVVVEANDLPFFAPTGLELDGVGDRAFLTGRNSNRVIVVELSTGAQSVLSDNTNHPGPRLEQPWSLELDRANDRIFVVNLAGNDILAVDLATGARSFVFDGPDRNIHERLTYDSIEDRLFVYRANAVYAIDITTGAETELSLPDGAPRRVVDDLAFDAARNWLYIKNFDGISAVDLDASTWQIVSARLDPGPAIGDSMVADGSRILTLGRDRLIEIDVVSGARRPFLARNVGGGDGFLFQQAQIAFDPEGERLFTYTRGDSFLNRHVVEVSIDGGDRRLLTEEPLDGLMVGLDWDPNRRRLLASARDDGITAIDPGLRTLEIITDEGAQYVAPEPGGSRLAVAFGTSSRTTLELFDEPSGSQVVVSDMQSQGGVSYASIRNLIWPRGGNRLLVMDRLNGLIEIDIASGARSVMSGGDVGEGPRLVQTSDFDIDVERGTVYAAAGLGLLSVDLQTGNRSPVSSVPLADAIAVDGPNRRAFLAIDELVDAIVTVELTTGDWVVTSR